MTKDFTLFNAPRESHPLVTKDYKDGYKRIRYLCIYQGTFNKLRLNNKTTKIIIPSSWSTHLYIKIHHNKGIYDCGKQVLKFYVHRLYNKISSQFCTPFGLGSRYKMIFYVFQMIEESTVTPIWYSLKIKIITVVFNTPSFRYIISLLSRVDFDIIIRLPIMCILNSKSDSMVTHWTIKLKSHIKTPSIL